MNQGILILEALGTANQGHGGVMRVAFRCPYTGHEFTETAGGPSRIAVLRTVVCPCCGIRWGLPSRLRDLWDALKRRELGENLP